ncbi:SET domain-containing protein, partial [Mycena leptocephala]
SAKITFSNEIDDEAVPPDVDALFRYLERNYIFDIGIPVPSNLVGCCCGTGCSRRRTRNHGSKTTAYTPQGLFKFNTDSKVIECNENCTCPMSCTNHVAQRPRQIPIEIFKTDKRGWGARTSDVLVRGQVLGLYTGCVRREKAHKLFGKRASYIFELDIDEEPGVNPRDAYSVDAFHCGNWTRFIKEFHSCSPNVQEIAVAYDTVDFKNDTPYDLAFVATEKICPGTELTLDYNPAKQGAWERKKYKDKAMSKRLQSKKQPRCLCGAKECRGWMA